LEKLVCAGAEGSAGLALLLHWARAATGTSSVASDATANATTVRRLAPQPSSTQSADVTARADSQFDECLNMYTIFPKLVSVFLKKTSNLSASRAETGFASDPDRSEKL
jgi:hypothetical protein